MGLIPQRTIRRISTSCLLTPTTPDGVRAPAEAGGCTHLPAGGGDGNPGTGPGLGCRERPVSGCCLGSTLQLVGISGDLSPCEVAPARDPGLGSASRGQRGGSYLLQHPHFEAFHEVTGLAGTCASVSISHLLVAGQLYSMLPGSRHRRVAACPGPPLNPPGHRLDGDSLITTTPPTAPRPHGAVAVKG